MLPLCETLAVIAVVMCSSGHRITETICNHENECERDSPEYFLEWRALIGRRNWIS